MNATDVIRTMLESSGMSHRQFCDAMGRKHGYQANILYRGSIPKVDTYARIADVCGYDLLVRRREGGDEIPVDPSK